MYFNFWSAGFIEFIWMPQCMEIVWCVAMLLCDDLEHIAVCNVIWDDGKHKGLVSEDKKKLPDPKACYFVFSHF